MEQKKVNKNSKNGKLNKRSLILLVSVIAIIIFVITLIVALVTDKGENNKGIENIGENVKLDEAGNKVNISDKLNSEKIFENYKIGNILLKTENGQTAFTANVTNMSGSAQSSQLIYITFVDKDDNELSKIGVYIRDMEAGETISTKATTSRDLTNAYDFKLSK